jgi:hypothetical protein
MNRAALARDHRSMCVRSVDTRTVKYRSSNGSSTQCMTERVDPQSHAPSIHTALPTVDVVRGERRCTVEEQPRAMARNARAPSTTRASDVHDDAHDT